MVAGRTSGTPDIGNSLSLGYFRTASCRKFAAVTVKGRQAVGMRYDNSLSVAAHPAGVHDDAGSGSPYDCSARRSDVKSGMEDTASAERAPAPSERA